jgi:hypothetical protein
VTGRRPPESQRLAAALHVTNGDAGLRVLRGDADPVALNGVDRWIGGVHPAGAESRWRWDEGTESIVEV